MWLHCNECALLPLTAAFAGLVISICLAQWSYQVLPIGRPAVLQCSSALTACSTWLFQKSSLDVKTSLIKSDKKKIEKAKTTPTHNETKIKQHTHVYLKLLKKSSDNNQISSNFSFCLLLPMLQLSPLIHLHMFCLGCSMPHVPHFLQSSQV